MWRCGGGKGRGREGKGVLSVASSRNRNHTQKKNTHARSCDSLGGLLPEISAEAADIHSGRAVRPQLSRRRSYAVCVRLALRALRGREGEGER